MAEGYKDVSNKRLINELQRKRGLKSSIKQDGRATMKDSNSTYLIDPYPLFWLLYA